MFHLWGYEENCLNYEAGFCCEKPGNIIVTKIAEILLKFYT